MPKWGKAERRYSPNESMLILIAAIPLLALLGYAEMSASRSGSREAVPPLSFGLNVSHADSELRLSWNPSAPPLRFARQAEVVIADGDHRSRLLLSPDQIRGGYLLYTPFTGAVAFGLQAASADSGPSETVLALERAAPNSRPLEPLASMLPLGAVAFPASFSRRLPH